MEEPTIEATKEAGSDEAKHTSSSAQRNRTNELKAQAKAATTRMTSEAEHAWTWTRGAVKKPKIGMGIAAVAVLGVGALFGVTEAIVAGGAGFIVYKTLQRRSRRRSKDQGGDGIEHKAEHHNGVDATAPAPA